MEYSRDAMAEVDRLTREFREKLLEIAMNEAANHDGTDEVEAIHVEWAYKRITD